MRQFIRKFSVYCALFKFLKYGHKMWFILGLVFSLNVYIWTLLFHSSLLQCISPLLFTYYFSVYSVRTHQEKLQFVLFTHSFFSSSFIPPCPCPVVFSCHALFWLHLHMVCLLLLFLLPFFVVSSPLISFVSRLVQHSQFIFFHARTSHDFWWIRTDDSLCSPSATEKITDILTLFSKLFKQIYSLVYEWLTANRQRGFQTKRHSWNELKKPKHDISPQPISPVVVKVKSLNVWEHIWRLFHHSSSLSFFFQMQTAGFFFSFWRAHKAALIFDVILSHLKDPKYRGNGCRVDRWDTWKDESRVLSTG